MALYTSTADVSGMLPDDYGALITQPVDAGSVAIQVSTLVDTGSTHFHVPVVTDDPAAAFISEGAEITPDDAVMDEVTVTPAKVAGLTIISSELANDSSPQAAEVVGAGLARDIAQRIDQAYFGNMVAPAPAGLGSIAATAVDAGASFANLDAFAQAMSNAEGVGAEITAFVANPADALALAQLKSDSTDSNQPLLGMDPSQPTRRLIFGVPLFVSPHVPANTVYGIPRERVLVVRRSGVELKVDSSAYFSSDRIGVRAIMRVGFAFPHEAAVQAITVTTA